jgi:hypothetical protein
LNNTSTRHHTDVTYSLVIYYFIFICNAWYYVLGMTSISLFLYLFSIDNPSFSRLSYNSFFISHKICKNTKYFMHFNGRNSQFCFKQSRLKVILTWNWRSSLDSPASWGSRLHSNLNLFWNPLTSEVVNPHWMNSARNLCIKMYWAWKRARWNLIVFNGFK